MLSDNTFPWEILNTHLLIPDRESITNKSLDVIKVQFGKPMGFIRVTYRNTYEGLLTGTEMTQETSQRPPQHV